MLLKVIPIDNFLFASEIVGAVRGIDPETGYYFDGTRPYIEGAAGLTDSEHGKIFGGNARRGYGRMNVDLEKIS